jgi:hypothetical protein
MLDKTIVSNMRYRNERVKKFQDIGASWKEEPNSSNAKNIYLVMFIDEEGQMQPGAGIWKKSTWTCGPESILWRWMKKTACERVL